MPDYQWRCSEEAWPCQEELDDRTTWGRKLGLSLCQGQSIVWEKVYILLTIQLTNHIVNCWYMLMI